MRGCVCVSLCVCLSVCVCLYLSLCALSFSSPAVCTAKADSHSQHSKRSSSSSSPGSSCGQPPPPCRATNQRDASPGSHSQLPIHNFPFPARNIITLTQSVGRCARSQTESQLLSSLSLSLLLSLPSPSSPSLSPSLLTLTLRRG